MSTSSIAFTKPWMPYCLLFAGFYNLLWGAFVVLFPTKLFEWLAVAPQQMPNPTGLAIWQCVGMIVGVYGIGYLCAAADPLRHWPIVLVGLLGKIFGPIGFVQSAYLTDQFPRQFGWTIITNDLIWWIPFALMLHAALMARRDVVSRG